MPAASSYEDNIYHHHHQASNSDKTDITYLPDYLAFAADSIKDHPWKQQSCTTKELSKQPRTKPLKQKSYELELPQPEAFKSYQQQQYQNSHLHPTSNVNNCSNASWRLGFDPLMPLYQDQASDYSSTLAPSYMMATQFPIPMTPPSQHYLTLEELKSARNSCWLCGCNWLQDHVSLDCSECGGYALTRPCPSCDGRCKQVWKRNINATHDHHKALWTGRCGFDEDRVAGKKVADSNVIPPASSCCSSRASSAASSDCESDSHSTSDFRKELAR